MRVFIGELFIILLVFINIFMFNMDLTILSIITLIAMYVYTRHEQMPLFGLFRQKKLLSYTVDNVKYYYTILIIKDITSTTDLMENYVCIYKAFHFKVCKELTNTDAYDIINNYHKDSLKRLKKAKYVKDTYDERMSKLIEQRKEEESKKGTII